MKAVILAGGYGTRISEESVIKPKPMVEIGEKPLDYYGQLKEKYESRNLDYLEERRS